MSELPVITYTDSEGQVFNFMSDLDDVRDYKRVLVPRTTPEEPLDVDLVPVSSPSGSGRISGKYSLGEYYDVYNLADKTLTGTFIWTDADQVTTETPFSINLEEGAYYDPQGVVPDIRTVGNKRNVYSSFDSFKSLSYYDGKRSFWCGNSQYFDIGTPERVFCEKNGQYIRIVLSNGTTIDSPKFKDINQARSIVDDNIQVLDVLLNGSFLRMTVRVLCDQNTTISSMSIRSDYSLNDRIIVDDTAKEFLEFSLSGPYVVADPYLIMTYETEEDTIDFSFSLVDGEQTFTYNDVEYSIFISEYFVANGKGNRALCFYITYPDFITPTYKIFGYFYPRIEITSLELVGLDLIVGLYAGIFPVLDMVIDNINVHMYYEYIDDGIYEDLLYSGRIIDGSFHEFEWDKSVSERQFGETVNGWTKSSKEYKANLLFSGTDEQKRLALNRFHSAIENDIMHETPGTLQWDDATIDCYIRGSNTKPSDKFNGYTENEITIYCPRPFWEHEITQQFYSGINNSESDTTYAKNWPHDYSGYDYLFINDRESYILNDGPLSEWQIIINGPARKPIIHIGNNIIAMNTEIPVDSYLMIDSRDKIIYLVNPDGSMDNRFGERDLENYIFEKIEPGYSKVTWNGSYEWLLTLYEESSEPRWPY